MLTEIAADSRFQPIHAGQDKTFDPQRRRCRHNEEALLLISYQREQYSPVSFEYLREKSRAIGEKSAGIWPAMEKRRNLRSIFDLVG